MEEIIRGVVISILMTGMGALPVLFLKNISHRRMDVLLAYTAGIMVAAATYGLIPSALQLANFFVLSCGILLGALVLNLLEYQIPHVALNHSHTGATLNSKSLMMIIAMTLHNVPEGLSVGISYASHVEHLGTVVAISIGLQNIPEGLLIALFLTNQGVSRRSAVIIAFLTGTIEAAASYLGFQLSAFARFVPYGLSFAAGAMLYIVYKELIPETHGHGYEREATFAFIFGLLTMIGLIVWFE
jgi:ZIP family zinc transporter